MIILKWDQLEIPRITARIASPIIIIINDRKYVSNISGNMKSRNSRKQPYWALHTYFGKY